jgi:hypothetical protein
VKHVRQKIRERVQADLLALAGGRVYSSRVYPDTTLPAIGIYANTEESGAENDSLTVPRRYTRNLDIVIEIKATAAANVDDAVDDLAAQVEALLAADRTLNSLATDTELVSTAHSQTAGERPLMVARLTYRVWYRTNASDAETAL